MIALFNLKAYIRRGVVIKSDIIREDAALVGFHIIARYYLKQGVNKLTEWAEIILLCIPAYS